jgi:hypothetical protein
MVAFTMVPGKTTKRTAWERKILAMAQLTRDIGLKVKEVAMVKSQIN